MTHWFLSWELRIQTLTQPLCCAYRGTQNSHPISLHPGEYRGTSKLSGNPWDKLASHQEGCSMIETRFLRRDPEFQQCLSPSREHKVPANCQEIPSRDKHYFKKGVVILLATLCYWNPNQLWQYWLSGS